MVNRGSVQTRAEAACQRVIRSSASPARLTRDSVHSPARLTRDSVHSPARLTRDGNTKAVVGRSAGPVRQICGRTMRKSVSVTGPPHYAAAVAAAASAPTCAGAVAAAGAAAAALAREEESRIIPCSRDNGSGNIPATPKSILRGGPGGQSSSRASSAGSASATSSCWGSSIRGCSTMSGHRQRRDKSLVLRPQACSGNGDQSIESSPSVVFASPALKGRPRSVILAGLRVFLLERFGNIHEAFDRMDFHKDGRISCLEWQEVLSGQERYCGLHEAREIFCYLARNTDGWLNWEDFSVRFGSDSRWRSNADGADESRDVASQLNASAVVEVSANGCVQLMHHASAHDSKRERSPGERERSPGRIHAVAADEDSAASTGSRCSSAERSGLAGHALRALIQEPDKQQATDGSPVGQVQEHEEELATSSQMSSRSSLSGRGAWAWSIAPRSGVGRVSAATAALRQLAIDGTGGTSIASASTSAVSGQSGVRRVAMDKSVGICLGKDAADNTGVKHFDRQQQQCSAPDAEAVASPSKMKASCAVSSVESSAYASPRKDDDSPLCGNPDIAQKAKALLQAATASAATAARLRSEHSREFGDAGLRSKDTSFIDSVPLAEPRQAGANSTEITTSITRRRNANDGGAALAKQFMSFLGGDSSSQLGENVGSQPYGELVSRDGHSGFACETNTSACVSGIRGEASLLMGDVSTQIGRVANVKAVDGVSRCLDEGLQAFRAQVAALNAMRRNDGCRQIPDTPAGVGVPLPSSSSSSAWPCRVEQASSLSLVPSAPAVAHAGLPWVALLPPRDQGRLAACSSQLEALNVLDDVLDAMSTTDSDGQLSSIPPVGSSGDLSSSVSCLRKGRWRSRSAPRGSDQVSQSCSSSASVGSLQRNGSDCKFVVHKGGRDAELVTASADLLRAESAKFDAMEEELRRRQKEHEAKVAEMRNNHKHEQKKAVRRMFSRLAPPTEALLSDSQEASTHIDALPAFSKHGPPRSSSSSAAREVITRPSVARRDEGSTSFTKSPPPKPTLFGTVAGRGGHAPVAT